MEGNNFLINRKIFRSDIWEKPAYYLKIWIWIIGRANWKEIKRGGKIYRRGEFKTDYDEIIEANKWRVGWRTEKLKKHEIFNVLDFLRKTQRSTTAKATRGLWIKVINYDNFQLIPRYESNNESNNEGNRLQTGKVNTINTNNNIASKRSDVSFNKKDYSRVLEAYQRLRGIKLQGQEFRPVEQAIKGMFMSDRTPEQIICCMEALNKHDFFKDKWDINFIKKKMPEFVAGKLTKDDSWQYAK